MNHVPFVKGLKPYCDFFEKNTPKYNFSALYLLDTVCFIADLVEKFVLNLTLFFSKSQPNLPEEQVLNAYNYLLL